MTPPLPGGYRVVEVPESRKDEFTEIDQLAFGFEPDAETAAQVPLTLEWDRTMGVEDPEGHLAAVHASFEFLLPVPGGASVPCAGLTWVGVRPDQRRRGLLSAMIDTHFERSLHRGEPVSALYAAEHTIYGRFGYGSAADEVSLTLARRAALREVAGSDELTVRFGRLDPAVHSPLVEKVLDEAGAARPGWIRRRTDELQRRALSDPPAWREGAEPLRIVTVHGPDGAPRAYALLRRKEQWVDNVARSTVQVRESSAVDAASAHRLWSFMLDMDLTSSVRTGRLAVDDRLRTLLLDPRSSEPRISDNVWVRLLDVPAALGARRWSAPLDVVLEVSDRLVPANAGRWRLTTGATAPDGTSEARVVRTDEPADVTLDVSDLGAAYLGGRSLQAAGRAGLVTEHRAGTLQATSTAFSWPSAPLCNWGF
ncbi:GNAT family N-acetyltransferase [Cellulomonas sp. P22]|uniref:GNAT family N-acetyltransferase n=1 Tax=Cellulomonas sp. P22 TaxID=3373189 RepID=UPI003796F2B0